jgi:3-methyl-2-oxobutanoate hydroxymethyltransferase
MLPRVVRAVTQRTKRSPWKFGLSRCGVVRILRSMSRERWTADRIKALKGQGKLPSLTAYDYPMALILDEMDIPLVLVGDSLGMVVLGYADTTHVTMEDMVHHVAAVARAKPRGMVVADLPYRAYESVNDAVANAKRLIDAGADGVKAEGGRDILDQVDAIVAAGIPFCGHLGMLPQHVVEEGGYSVKGKTDAEREALLANAKTLDEAGAFAMVLELVRKPVAAEITAAVSAPTIGIGSGPGCDGQILVTTDLWGTSPGFIPKHVRPDMKIPDAMRAAVGAWKSNL